MNKNLIYESDKNTRNVLVEKAERYYYKKDSKTFCNEKCTVFKEIFIGSYWCAECEHNIGYNDYDGYIICEKIKPYALK